MKHTFLDIEENKVKPFINILPVKYQGTVSYMSGTKDAPDAIIKASSQVECFSSYLKKDTSSMGFNILPVIDKGLESPEKAYKKIYNKIIKYIDEYSILCSIGGEHSISIPIVNAHKEVFKKEFDIIVFDAHLDLRDSYHNTIYSHACVNRRLYKEHKIFIIGARSYCEEEYRFINKNKTRVGFAEPNSDHNKIIESVKKLNKDIYLSIDCDGFDPSVFPATGTPVPGGLGYIQGLEIIKDIISEKNIIGLDFVELIPDKYYGYGDFAASQLLYDIFGMMYIKKNIKIKRLKD